MRIVALVPAFNEEHRIAATIQAIAKIPQLDQIVVIDDGSRDNTADVARKNNAHLIRLEKNKGKGGALNTGWQQVPADIYLLLDADLEHSAILGGELLLPLIEDKADMSIANFVGDQVDEKEGKTGFGLAKGVARLGIRCLSGYKASSPLSGQRAVSAQILRSCGGVAQDFGVEVGLTIDAVRAGFRVVEVDLPMTHRATGRDIAGFKHRGRQLWIVLKTMWRIWRRYP